MPAIDIEAEDGRKEALQRMLRIREFDTKVGEYFADGDIPGFVHLYVGEEAVGVGACAALEEDDYITSTHRGHGHCIAKGLDPKLMMAEVFGKREGYCNGKGGSMHIADVDSHMLGANGIVGAGPPLGTGAALSITQKDEDRVALSFCGDGAVAQGQVHEAVNLASAWSLPVIFLVENNQYGEGTPVSDQHNVENLSDTAAAYDIPGINVDGMDIIAVNEAVEEARKRARDGAGPTFIEADTYRFHGHFEGDQELYRDEEEVEEWRKRDPIDAFSERLIDRDELTDEELEEMRTDIETEIEEALEYAMDADDPSPEEAYEDMFGERVPDIDLFVEQANARADGGIRGGGF
ncbi:thiamine pyrophosphate-dependent dehydrogenase E1 component subunit alpha [Halococcus sp. IIIV-5B]|uniref:thiamine pyrophosphate-dependent dehydrogenase E1 component subunit alpha n=1 Tax=Halococcus sp. IIIV-5B TaxID=2321230 RepID=UPI000E769A83|nr:thiamine pyrophosphate-dependent dehydrogenase E1 component subunit alpha [Halococcus sp. IIIV-5B]RJT08023.1 thiamine pyrophosphate-dependent dehydrogenase E1 component subunit alpha [Halococcus sp. IIIV-5B]